MKRKTSRSRARPKRNRLSALFGVLGGVAVGVAIAYVAVQTGVFLRDSAVPGGPNTEASSQESRAKAVESNPTSVEDHGSSSCSASRDLSPSQYAPTPPEPAVLHAAAAGPIPPDHAVRAATHTEPVRQRADEPPSGAPSKGSVRQTITLWNTTPDEFEANLRRVLADRLTPVDRTGGAAEYGLSLAKTGGLRLRVDAGSGKVVVEGDERAVQGAAELVRALDSPMASAEGGIRLVAMPRANPDELRRLVRAVQSGGGASPARQQPRAEARAVVMQDPPEADPPEWRLPLDFPQPPDPDDPDEEIEPDDVPPPDDPVVPGDRLVAPVQVEIVEGLDALIIRGRPEDVRRVAELIRQIEHFAMVMEPSIEVVPLEHVVASTLADLLEELYQRVYAAREGPVSITPMAAPNSLLLIGRPESVEKMLELVDQLDQPFPPAERFRIFRLQRIPAEEAQERIIDYFTDSAAEDASLAPRVFALVDFRSNSLIVRASPRDLAEAAALLTRLDSGQSDAFNEVRVFPLRNSLAEVLAPILQDAVTGQMYGQRARVGPAVAIAQDFERKSTRLRLVTIGEDGDRVLQSGILTDTQITADPRTNSLIVTADADSMPLVAALIRELDQPSEVESQIKVFTLVNGDATNMAAMLENIFGVAVTGAEIAVRTGIVEEETTLVGLRFAVDVRTNSIIATGSIGALTVVEAVLSRLDAADVRERRNEVYRLKNSFAPDVAEAVNQFLISKREVELAAPGLLSAFEIVEREVIVVPEPVTNSLIVSATPRYFEDIAQLVEQLDRRPPMAMIQVVIAEVTLSDFDEFGIEMGLQDSILFNRQLATGGLAIPGALFSDAPSTGGQAHTGFGTGRLNTDLAFGGLVLSASSQSVSVLIRALQQAQKLRVLSRPQVMTLDNQPAQIVVGEDVPFITGTTFTEFGQQNVISYREVGLILTVTPRISPDGLVVMEIVATNSSVGRIDDGIPVSVAGGVVIRSPRIQMISAQTVVSALDGQTVVLGGLIVDDDARISRRVPYLSDIPLVGNLFQYKSASKSRRELLIIMTPRIVDGVEQAEQIAHVESARMNWCLHDVERMHGGYGPDPFFHDEAATTAGPRVIYPHLTPTVDAMPDWPAMPQEPEVIPTPPAIPRGPERAPAAPGVPEGPEVIPTPAGRPIAPLPSGNGRGEKAPLGAADALGNPFIEEMEEAPDSGAAPEVESR